MLIRPTPHHVDLRFIPHRERKASLLSEESPYQGWMKRESACKNRATEEEKRQDDSWSGASSPYAQHHKNGESSAARVCHKQRRPDDQRARHPNPQGASRCADDR